MVIPAATELVNLPAIVSALAATTALAVSLWVEYAQRQLIRRQIKQSLYEKRYAIFLAAEDFLMHVLRVDGSIKLPSEEFRKFHDATEQTEFLFGADVVAYMDQLKKTACDLYPKAFERDHLAAMNQQKPELDLEITKALMEIGGRFVEKRKEVFGPYLQLSPSEMVEGSAASRRLNGWHRLSVVVAVMWLLPVVLFSYTDWPTAANVSKDDVYYQMKPDDGHRLTDYYDVMASRLGGTNVVAPRIAEMQQDKYFLAASPKDQKAYLSRIDPDFAKASSIDQNAYLGHITGITGPTADIDGHTVQFIQDVREEEMHQTTGAYHAALHRILRHKRAGFIGEALALWVMPLIALLALVYAIQWVRRGFSTSTAV
jgi:hypothetical protein